MSAGPPLPPRLAVPAAAGALALRWDPLPAGARAVVVVALRPLAEPLAEAFWSGALDADLLRYPVDAGAGAAELTVPAGRPLEVLLVARDAAGASLPCPAPRLAAAAPAPALLEAPPRHARGPAPDTPLVLVEGAGGPDLAALARRVAERAHGGPPAPLPAPGPGGFGARQRWTLVRLAWEPPGGPQALVRRARFIDAAAVAAWRDAPPEDAVALPADADGLVDGEAPPDATTFYAVLAGPAPWRSLPLAPDPPPFEGAARPWLLGDVAGRLAAAVRARLVALEREPLAGADLPPRLALLEAAVGVLPPDHPARAEVAASRRRWAGGRLVDPGGPAP